MLNKEVCKRCSEKCYAEKWNGEIKDEILWENGFLICPRSDYFEEDIKLPTTLCEKVGIKYGATVFVINKIPKACPYRLEHLMMKTP